MLLQRGNNWYVIQFYRVFKNTFGTSCYCIDVFMTNYLYYTVLNFQDWKNDVRIFWHHKSTIFTYFYKFWYLFLHINTPNYLTIVLIFFPKTSGIFILRSMRIYYSVIVWQDNKAVSCHDNIMWELSGKPRLTWLPSLGGIMNVGTSRNDVCALTGVERGGGGIYLHQPQTSNGIKM